MPPPVSAAMQAEWCGARNGRRSGQRALGDQPATEWTIEVSSSSAGRQRRQDAGQARGQHRLARAGRADEQQVVAAGRGDLQRPLGVLLALDVAQVGQRGSPSRTVGLGPRQHLGAAEVVDQRDQRARREDRHVPPAQAASGPQASGQIRPVPGAGGDGGGQRARHRRDAAVQRQLAQHRPALQRVGGITPMAAMIASAIGRS